MALSIPHPSDLVPVDAQPGMRQTAPVSPRPSNWLRWLDDRQPVLVCISGVFVILSIGVLSYATGPQLSCSLFYLIPVILMTRAAGFHAGIAAAILAATIWMVVDINGGTTFRHSVTPYWNAVMRLGTFAVAVGLVSAMRSLTNHLEERVKERTAALEAEIAEKRELEKNILDISDIERASIGQDLHDGLCQQLVSAAFSCNLLQESLTSTTPDKADEVNRIAEMIDDSITQARNLARGLYPVRLETEGLEMALRELASSMNRRSSTVCTVDCPAPMPPCGHAAGIHFYRIAQEAMVNATKHAHAGRVVVSLCHDTGRVQLIIQDDGQGIRTEVANPSGMGLRIMEYRARLIGADFRMESHPGQGTRVKCDIDANTFLK